MGGRLTQMTYVPEKLFSINTTTSKRIQQLFAKNEQFICYFDTITGEIEIVLVFLRYLWLALSQHGIIV